MPAVENNAAPPRRGILRGDFRKGLTDLFFSSFAVTPACGRGEIGRNQPGAAYLL